MKEEEWTTVPFRNQSRKRRKPNYKQKETQQQYHDLSFLQNSLETAYQISLQSLDLSNDIIELLQIYTYKIKNITMRNIWQPSNDFEEQLLKNNKFLDLVPASASAAEPIPPLHPTPYYSNDFPSYFLEGKITPGKHLPRTRSTSWSTPIRSLAGDLEYSSKRLLSPPFEKKYLDLVEIQQKQDKAMELRQLAIQEKLRKQNEKAQSFKQRMTKKEVEIEEQRKLLEKAIDEKLLKAEKSRTVQLETIKNKARQEDQRRSVVQKSTALLIQTKKTVTENRLEESKQRRLGIEDEKMKKTSEILALQKAATDRRIKAEAEKLQKLAKKEAEGQQRVEELERMREAKKEQNLEKQKTVQTRALEIKTKKIEQEEEKKRALNEKLELSAQRKDDQVRQKREKAAFKNQNAKIVATRVQLDRKTTSSSAETTPNSVPSTPTKPLILTPTFNAASNLEGGGNKLILEELKLSKKKLKRVRQKLEFATKDYYFIPTATTTSLDATSTLLLSSLTKALLGLDFANELSIKRLESLCEQANAYLINSVEDCVFNVICEGDILDLLVRVLAKSPIENENHLSVLQHSVCLLTSILENQVALKYFCESSNLHLTKIVDVLCKITPFCSPSKPKSSENSVAISLIRLLSKCLNISEIDKTINLFINYSICSGIFDNLAKLFALIHGTPQETEGFMTCLMETTILVDKIITIGNEKLLETPSYEEKKLSVQTQSIISFCVSSNVIGLVTVLDSILLSSGGSYRTAIQATISEDWIEESLRVFKILNKLFHLSVYQIQDWLAEKDQVTELFHLMLFWMHYFSTKNHPKSLNPLIDEIIRTLGNVCQGNSRHTQMVCIGLPGPSLLQRLCLLPFSYFNSERGRTVLFPTLIELARDKNNRSIIEEDLSLDFLLIFLRNHQNWVSPTLRKEALIFLNKNL